ncbi:MAG: hypothetical protein AAF790_10290 [Planctomycetota bacterium]
MPRYVLLRHEWPADYRDGPHWDLMIEHGDALQTWSLLTLPAAWAGRGAADGSVAGGVPAVLLAPHRLAYLDYEGPISGGRGAVARHARGEARVTQQTDDAWSVEATTGELAGRWELTRAGGDAWLLAVT